MGLLQPPSGPANPLSLGEYRSADVLLWIAIIIAVVAAFLLLVDFVNTRKPHHLYWGLSFIASWIVFHQVANTGSYGLLLDSVVAFLFSFIPGLIATGMLSDVFTDKRLLGRFKYHQLYFVYIFLMGVFLGFSSVAHTTGPPGNLFLNLLGLDAIEITWVPALLLLFSVIPSMVIMVGVPIYTTIKTKETTKAAYLVAVGGLLLGLAGIFRILVVDPRITDVLDPFILMGLFPYFMLFSVVFLVIGWLYVQRWRFDVPGVEFAD